MLIDGQREQDTTQKENPDVIVNVKNVGVLKILVR